MNTLSSLLYFLGDIVFDAEISEETKDKYEALGWTEPQAKTLDSLMSFLAQASPTAQSTSLTSQTLSASGWKDFQVSVTAPSGIADDRLVCVRAWDISGSGSSLVACNGITTSKARVDAGETFTVHVKARNYGTADASNLTITVYLAYI